MKKFLSLVTLLVTALSLAACSGNLANPDGITAAETKEPGTNIYGTIQGDWPVYQNASELVDSAKLVFTGRVTGISFQMLDLRDPETIGDDIDDWHYNLFTMYDVDIITSYKGEARKSIQVRMMGGLKDYQVEEQLELLAQYNKQYIPILEGHVEYKVGETYLFVLHQYMDVSPTPMNLTQGAYNLHDPFKKYTIGSYDLDDSYYIKAVDDYGNPIISAKDVILTFGREKWESFWVQWQKDNADWETWLDKEAVERALFQ